MIFGAVLSNFQLSSMVIKESDDLSIKFIGIMRLEIVEI